jgi:uncharacterized cupredoxin-like copper-binding protein
VRQRTLGVVLIALGLVGMLGIGWAFASGSDGYLAAPGWVPFGGIRGGPTCTPPTLPGQAVDVVLSDMGGMMSGGTMSGARMMNVAASRSSIPAGDVSFRVWNAGMMVHELVVLPLPPDGVVGTRTVGSDGRVSEEGSLGEASRTCGEGAGEGIAPGVAGWVILHLDPGRYELICNLPGHYAAGMFTELDVR